ncbi:MAG: hypothetical protein PHP98_00830 [Kiritimatiellae bacterium]|nr:hypothetical protein [Kiritimatiellia bacterium]
MKTGKISVALMAAVLMLSVYCFAAPEAPKEVTLAAEQGLRPFLSEIADTPEQFGFTAGDDLNAASLGAPFQLHTIPPSALEKYQAGMTVASMVTPTTTWWFPVLIAGEPRAMLLVDRLDGRWEAVSLGHAGVAQELSAFCRQWKAAQGYHPMLIAVFQAKQFLVSVPEKDAYNLTTLTIKNAPEMGAKQTPAVADYATLGTIDDAMNQLKPVVRDALKGSDQ